MNTDTPETDDKEIDISSNTLQVQTRYVRADFARKLERERNAYQTALREMVAAKGRYNTQTAMERLIALLPENQTTNTTK